MLRGLKSQNSLSKCSGLQVPAEAIRNKRTGISKTSEVAYFFLLATAFAFPYLAKALNMKQHLVVMASFFL